METQWIQDLAQYYAYGTFSRDSKKKHRQSRKTVAKHVVKSFFKISQPYFGNPALVFFRPLTSENALSD